MARRCLLFLLDIDDAAVIGEDIDANALGEDAKDRRRSALWWMVGATAKVCRAMWPFLLRIYETHRESKGCWRTTRHLGDISNCP